MMSNINSNFEPKNNNNDDNINFYDDDIIDDVMNIVKNDDLTSKQENFYLKEYNIVDEVYNY